MSENGSAPVWRTPDEMVREAKEQMIGGREPCDQTEWALVMNFIARNVHPDVAEPACLLMGRLYAMELDDQDIRHIVAFQQAKAREQDGPWVSVDHTPEGEGTI